MAVGTICLLCGCGAATPAQSDRTALTVARIGDRAVTSATLEHWMRVLAPSHLVPLPPRFAACVARLRSRGGSQNAREATCSRQREELVQSTLDFLIAGDWLLGEAKARGLLPSAGEVRRRLKRERAALSSTEFHEVLTSIGETLGDRELEIETGLARRKLRAELRRSLPKVSLSEALAAYSSDRSHYHTSERRYFLLVETNPVRKERNAIRRIHEVLRLKNLAGVGLHESLLRREVAGYEGTDTNVLGAIFAARAHVMTGPLLQDGHRFVFEVTRIVPPQRVPFVRVHKAIEKALLAKRWRAVYDRFISVWRSKWLARTYCAPGYVVSRCRQYKGRVAPEDPLGAS